MQHFKCSQHHYLSVTGLELMDHILELMGGPICLLYSLPIFQVRLHLESDFDFFEKLTQTQNLT